MNTKSNIVIVCAHPDDVAHSMGGTAYLLKDKYQLHIFCLTKGERGNPGMTMNDSAAIREKEELSAAAILGAQVVFPGLIDGDVCADRAICEWMSDRLKELNPVALFTLWPINIPDHFMAYAIAIKALQLSGLLHTIDVYMPENAIGVQITQFDPDLYVDIGHVIDKKKEMIRCHKSQNPNELCVERVIERNHVRGMMVKCEWAEPFKVMAPLINKRGERREGRLLLDL